MNIRTAMMVLSLVITAANADQAPRNHVLTVEQISQDIALARQAYERVHPGYDRYTDSIQLDNAWLAIEAQARKTKGMRVGDFYQAVQSVLAQIRCDHTKAELPETLKEARQQLTAYLPARWEIIEGRAFVVAAISGSGLRAKDEVLSIEGVAIDTLIESYAPLVSVDGFTEHYRQTQLAFSSEFMGGVIEHFSALKETVAQTVDLKLLRDGKPLAISVNRVDFKTWREFLNSVQPFYRNFKDEVHYQPIGKQGAFLAVNTFVNYRQPVDPVALFDGIFSQMKAQDRDKLIIDLRTNGGGSTDAMLALLSFLIDQPMAASKGAEVKTIDYQDLLSHMTTWDQAALEPQPDWFYRDEQGRLMVIPELDMASQTLEPHPNRFTGEVVVLTASANSSGSANLLALLNELENVTMIGEPTGGSAEGPTANVLFFLTLPNSGVITRLPAQRTYNNVSQFEPGLGVMPDIEVPVTAADWLADKDAARLSAMKFLDL